MIDHNKLITEPKKTKKMKQKNDASTEENLQHEAPVKIKNNKRKKVNNGEFTSLKKKGKLNDDLTKEPTVEELCQLREAEDFFHSNLFRLQIEEILNAVKVKNKYKKLFETWFEEFKNSIENIKSIKEVKLTDDTYFDVKIPMTSLPNDCVGNFQFEPPNSITIGGSYSLETVVGPEISVDILVEMPESLFQKIDCKNYRYMRKKAIYLAHIAQSIDKDLVEFKCFVGNHSHPILKIIPSGKLSKKCIVYINLVVQETAFSLNKFTPEKNNVKYNWFFQCDKKDSEINTPTSYYNNVVMRDLSTFKISTECFSVIKEYPNIRDGIILLKIWLRQREFNNNFESFNGHIITMYVLYLLHIKKLNTLMSSYQIVRNTWQNLANSNWCKEGISFCQEENIKEKVSLYHRHYDCVFLDSTGFYNLAANIPEDTFKWISNQAQLSIDCLNNTRVNGFQVLFMRKIPFYNTFDYIICLHHQKALENVLNQHSNDSDKLNYGSSKYMYAVKYITKLLKQGLGRRISFINFLPRKIKEWGLNDEIPNDIEKCYIGIQLDPNFCFNVIDKGPGANLVEAQEFRKFWGNKSELRRFKDSTICEAVVWSKENAKIAQKRAIPQIITTYLLEEKLKLFGKTHYFYCYNQVEHVLNLKKVQFTKYNYGMEEATLKVLNIFSSLEKELTNLSDLPLSISGVQGCNSLFRYTNVFPPLSTIHRPDEVNVVSGKTHLLFTEEKTVNEVPFHLSPVEGVIQMTMSGKWPDDLEALRMTKAAFYLQIAECVRKQCKVRAQGSLHHIDIMKDGLVFRFRIAHQKEIGLLKQQVGEDGVLKYRDNEESTELENQLFHLPRITGALYGIHCQQPSFGPACCLAKRWLSAHLIDEFHMPDIVVDLLMASLYLNSDPYKPAQLPQVAFHRFLESFAKDHWSTEPIIVNFNKEMTREEIVEIDNTFSTSRETLPPLFISTPYDHQSSIWTKKAPTMLVLNRIGSLAREAIKILENQLFTSTYISSSPLFIPSLSEYDCLIELKSSLNARRLETICIGENFEKVDLHPFKEHSKARIPVIGFDPVSEYLKELRSIYNDFALFFHDTYGGNIIGVLLKPQALQVKDFKVSNTHCQKFNSDRKLILNVSAMIEDFYVIGKGLVETINIQSKKLNAL